jgi:ArsR family transcriptional regulator, arsenate/arsenite/antimonite-responsive transcriptional repressor
MDLAPPPVPELGAAARAFAALGAPQRLAILRLLVRAGPRGLPMGRLADAAGLAAPTLTHHLDALVAAGLVGRRRQGRHVFAALDHGRVRALSDYLLENCCADADCDRQPEPESETADG